MSVEQAGTFVRSMHNPAKIGTSTGNKTRHQGQDYIFVRWKDGDEEPVATDELEIAPTEETRLDAFAAGRFSSPSLVRRALMAEKIRGHLTNVLYSMGSGQADFFPHQFKPVLTFFSGSTGRLLIADEVGLGKTVEAIYIWRELQARNDSRRMLIVCPAVLRTKWQRELRDRFQVDAPIVSAGDLLDLVRDATRDPAKSFVAIAGIESIRVRLNDVEANTEKPPTRVQLGQHLQAHETSEDFSLFDFLVIDEAHYLRNPETATHQTGLLLSSAASNLALLTATPIQIGSENLYNLLKLVDPDRFSTLDSFERIRVANSSITKALNAVRQTPVNLEQFRNALDAITQNSFFKSDHLFEQWLEAPPNFSDPDERVAVARQLEDRSLLSQVLTRTRKRDVIENRVKRDPNTLLVSLSSSERAIYDQVTAAIKRKARGADTINTLALIARQRQLASSIPAALAGWADNPATAELLIDELGYSLDEADLFKIENFEIQQSAPINAASFEAGDTKYTELSKFVKNWYAEHPNEKVVIFSFFRATLKYLRRRLESEGIPCALILGGMGDEKDVELSKFQDANGPKILLSSEVGSEGIDLQFARVVVNYDLPWNPMRVEQRIGRIDRLGQKAEKINIVSFVLRDTIEEVILDRLYNRIEIFHESIGDLEEILGESIDNIAVEYFRGDLSDEEVAEKLQQNAIAAAEYRHQVNKLENEAPELAGNMEFILSSIQAGRDAGRWIRPEDLKDFVLETLLETYPGSRLEAMPPMDGVYQLRLSPEASAELGIFMERTKPSRSTRLKIPGADIKVVFDPALHHTVRPRAEIIDITHPLIGLLRSEAVDGVIAEPVTCVAVDRRAVNVPPGVYAFATDLWRFEGLRRDIRLQTLATSVQHAVDIEGDPAERLADVALREGERVDFWDLAELHHGLLEAYQKCEENLRLRFVISQLEFRQENNRRIEQARVLVNERASAKLKQLQEMYDDQRRSLDTARQRASQMTAGRIKKVMADRDNRLARIDITSKTTTASRRVTGGIIIVGGA